jgi:hypothetical protein
MGGREKEGTEEWDLGLGPGEVLFFCWSMDIQLEKEEAGSGAGGVVL